MAKEQSNTAIQKGHIDRSTGQIQLITDTTAQAISLDELKKAASPDGENVGMDELHEVNIKIYSIEKGKSFKFNDAPFVRIIAQRLDTNQLINFVSFSIPVLKVCAFLLGLGLKNPVIVKVVCSNPHSDRAYFTLESPDEEYKTHHEPTDLEYTQVEIITEDEYEILSERKQNGDEVPF